MKSTRPSGLVLASLVGVVGLGAGVALSPVAASAATTTATTVTNRVTTIEKALSGLVSNGTITQAQADKVASTLDTTLPARGFGGHGGGFGRGADLDTAASVIGLTADQIRTQLDAGKTLVQVAATKGISQASLVSKLTAAEKTSIAAAVKAGTITQAQATERLAGLTARITQEVTQTRPAGGHGDGDGDGPGGGSPSAPTASPSSSTTS